MDDEKRPLLGSGASKTPSDPTLLITHQEIRKVVSAGKLASSSDGGTVTLAEKFIADVRIAKREASYQDVAGLAATGRIPSIQRVNSQTTKQAIFRVGSQSANLGGDGGEGSSGDLLGAESTTVEVERGGDSDPNAWKLDVKVFERYIRNTTAPGFRKHPKKVRDFYRRQNEVIHSFMEVERRFAKYETDVGEVLEESERSDRMATHLSNIFNLLLLIAKVVVAYFSGSLSVISSLIDSAVDMLSGLVLWFAAMRIDDHNPYLYPIGRQQLEPLSIVILATVMAVASVEVIRESVNSLVTNEIEVTFDLLSTAIMGATIVIKLALWTYCKTISTPTGQALSLDHFNDIVSNIGAVIFAWGAVRLWKPLDPIGAILMALYIIFSWFKTGREEIQGLSGRSASPDFLKTMTWIARNHHPYIMAVETVTAYHVGAKLLAEVDIVLDPETPLPVAHDIAETLQLKYEDLEEIERAFVHIDFELVHDRRFEHARHL